jgi:hypothetical protein
MNAARERIVRVIGPFGRAVEQSRAQRIERARTRLVDRALDALTDLARVSGPLTREEPDDRVDERLAATASLRFH